MLCKDALYKVIERQTQGVMFHDEMTDYYEFLHLDELKKLHQKQTKDEMCLLRKLKCEYIKSFNTIPMNITVSDPKVIPAEWKNKTTEEITEDSLKILIKSSLEEYLAWERETCEIYKRMTAVFKDNMHFSLYRKMCDILEDVQLEICKVTDLLVDAASYNFCPSYFK